MKVTLNAGDSIEVPENCKVVEKNGMVFFEPVSPFKKGDFCFTPVMGGWIYIYKSDGMERGHYHFVTYCVGDNVLDLELGHRLGNVSNCRLATESEKQLLIDKLHEAGKDWDAEKCEIVDLKYIPKNKDLVKIEWNSETFGYGYAFVRIKRKGGSNIYRDGDYLSKLSDREDVILIKSDGVADNINNVYTKLTPEEFQAEFNKLGYEYDFETNTAKKLEWRPKIGEPFYTPAFYSNDKFLLDKWCNSQFNSKLLESGLIRQTQQEAEKLHDAIVEFAKAYK